MKKPQCPHCDSFDTYPADIGIRLLMIGFGINLIGIVVWPFLVIGVPLAVIGLAKTMFGGMLMSFKKKPYTEPYKCKNCNGKFYVWFKMSKGFFMFRRPHYCPTSDIPKDVKLDQPISNPLKNEKK